LSSTSKHSLPPTRLSPRPCVGTLLYLPPIERRIAATCLCILSPGARPGGPAAGYDFTERATRFESSFAEGDGGAAEGVVPITVLPDKVRMCILGGEEGGRGGPWWCDGPLLCFLISASGRI